MAAYIVSYDLHKQGQNYTCIIEKLKTYNAWHMQQSVWIVISAQNAVAIRDNLLTCLDANDKLFVGLLSAAAWSGYSEDVNKWLVASIK